MGSMPSQRLQFIFDLDGTLVDSLSGITASIRHAVRGHGDEVSHAQVRELIGPPVRQVLKGIVGDIPAADMDRIERDFRTAYDSAGWRQAELYPAALTVLQSLYDEAFQLFVFTNKPNRAAKAILGELGIDHLFRATVSKDSRVPGYVSKTEMLQTLMHDHGLVETDCIVIGDSQEDFHAARHMRTQFIFASYGYGKLDRTGRDQDVRSIEGLGELLTFCGNGIANDR